MPQCGEAVHIPKSPSVPQTLSVDHSAVDITELADNETRAIPVAVPGPTIDSVATNPDRLGKGGTWFVALAICSLLAGLPLAIWLDLRNLSNATLRLQSDEVGMVIDTARDMYTQKIVKNLEKKPEGKINIVHNYHDITGAIPIPATLSIELGEQISNNSQSM